MFKIKTFNKIADVGLQEFPYDQYRVGPEQDAPDAMILRSHNLLDEVIPAEVMAVARAGAGTNNVPVDQLTARGVVVFNTPGANANAVKELVMCAMLLGSRNICQSWDFSRRLLGDDAEMSAQIESQKKQFKGFELAGRSLGVVGLGAIGVQVANAALSLGMNVMGYDPSITVQRAWELSANVVQADNIDELLQYSDIVTVHVPLLDSTEHLINAQRLLSMPIDSMLINFSRQGIVDDKAVLDALNRGQLRYYITDFPSQLLQGSKQVIALPHIGASTHEAEENCARMAVRQVRSYLEEGNIENSVNFPTISMRRDGANRLAIVNANVPLMVAKISGILGAHQINIVDLLNKSRGQIAYTLIDVNDPIPDTTLEELRAIDGVLSVRLI